MKQSAKRVISSGIALVMFVAALVIFFSFVVPLYGDISRIRGEEASRRALLENQKSIVAQVKSLVANYQEGSQLQGIVSSALPLDPNIADALLQLNGIAQANNLTPRAFVVTAAPAVTSQVRNDVKKTTFLKDTSSFTIRVDSAGTYQDFKGFLRNLETNIRLFDVKGIVLQPLGKPNQDAYLYSVTVAAYYQNQ